MQARVRASAATPPAVVGSVGEMDRTAGRESMRSRAYAFRESRRDAIDWKYGKISPILSPTPRATGNNSAMAQSDYKTYMCLICGFIYDEAAGLPDEGIAPGTRWDDLPPNWSCPECDARKEDFEMIEI